MNIRLIIILVLFCHACGTTPSEEQKEAIADKAEAQVVSQEQDTLPVTPYDLNFLTGNFDPSTHEDFTKIASKYTSKENIYMHKEAYEAFEKMYEAAKQDGIKLRIISAGRNFEYQRGLWEVKWTGERQLSSGENAAKDYPDPKARALKILNYSAMPGTSRHHWGTDIDLNALNNKYFGEGEGLKLYQWLTTHASDYGFCQPYSKKGAQRPEGYNEEKWHWSYLPVAKPLTDLAKQQLKNDMIKGFKGAEAATQIDVVKNYVLGINQDCL